MPSDDDRGSREPAGFRCVQEDRPGAESLGEAMLGSLLDRAHMIPPRLVGPLAAQEAIAAGATEVAVCLQDVGQKHLQPLEGDGLAGRRCPVNGSAAGQAFTTDSRVEEQLDDGSVRLFLPMLDGSDRVGVLSLRLPEVKDADRRLAQRLAGLVADLVVTKNAYTDTFARTHAAQPMALAAQLQWTQLPPLTMTTPDVDLAGILEPAYEVGGDAFDYALNAHVLHVGMLDAMGHGLQAATMSTVALAAYRHGRRADAPLADLYAAMDAVVAGSFPSRFATAQIGRLDTETGELSWVDAGHPTPLWVRNGQGIGELAGTVSRPIGLGGAAAAQSVRLEPGDRVLLFTDGVIEERLADGEQFGGCLTP